MITTNLSITIHYPLEVVTKAAAIKIAALNYDTIMKAIDNLRKECEGEANENTQHLLLEQDRRDSIGTCETRGLQQSTSSMSSEEYFREVKRTTLGLRMKNKKCLFFYKKGTKEIPLTEGKVFTNIVHIVVRFEDDPVVLIEKCKMINQRFIDATTTQSNMDGLGLNLSPSRPIKEKQVKKDQYNVAVYLSNPLVTMEQHQMIVDAQYQELNINSSENNSLCTKTMWTYDKEPEYKESFKTFFANIKKAHPNISEVIRQAELGNIRLDTNIKIRQLHCGVEKDNQGKIFLLLENDEIVGCQKHILASELLQSIPSDSLAVIVGLRADLVHQMKEDMLKKPLVITINTPHFSTDVLAITFLQEFYNRLFELTDPTIQEGIVRIFQAVYQSLLLTDPEPETRHIQPFLCCCQHDHTVDCQFLKLSRIYGMHTCHQQYHRHCSMKFASACRKSINCPFSGLRGILTSQISKRDVKSCFDFCCCSTRTIDGALSLSHNLSSKVNISNPLKTFETTFQQELIKPKQFGNKSVVRKIENFSKVLHEPRFRVSSAFLYSMVNRISRAVSFDAQVKIFRVTCRNCDSEDVKASLINKAIEYTSCRVESSFQYIDHDMQGKYFTDIKGLIKGRLTHEDSTKGLHQRFDFDTKVIVLYNYPSQEDETKSLFERSLLSLASELGKKFRLRIFLVGENCGEIAGAQHINYENFSPSEFIYRLAQQPGKRQYEGVVELDQELKKRGFVKNGFSLNRSLISWKALKSKFENQTILARLSVFPNGLTEVELQHIKFNLWKKPSQEIDRKQIIIEQDDRWGAEVFKVNPRLTFQRDILKSGDIAAMEYLAKYTGAALYYSDNPKKAQESMQEGSALSSMGIFFYRRSTQFKELFESEGELYESEISAQKEYQKIKKSLKEKHKDRQLDCETMFKLQELNLIGLLKSHDMEYWESNEQLFHYFCVLVLNLSALLKLQKDQGIQIKYVQHMEFMMYQVEKIKNHPKSKSLLYMQLAFTYIGMKRLWGKSTTCDLERLNERFLSVQDGERMADAWGQNRQIELTWKVEYCINNLLGRTKMYTDSHLKKQFCDHLRLVYQAIQQLTDCPIPKNDEKDKKDKKDTRKDNINRLRSRMAVLSAEGLWDGGMNLIEDMKLQRPAKLESSEAAVEIEKSFFTSSQNENMNSKQQSGIKNLRSELIAASSIFEKCGSSLLHVRAKLCDFHIGLEQPEFKNVFNIQDSQATKKFRKEERKHLQTTKQQFDEFEEKFFGLNRIDYAHKKTHERMKELRSRLNERMREHAKHTFIILATEIRQGHTVPILYQYESTMKFLMQERKNLNINTSTLMNRMSKQQLKRCCDSGAEVLFLLIDFDQKLGTINVDYLDKIGTESIQSTVFCSWIAMSNCRTIVLCGHNISELIKIIKPAQPTRFSISPVIIPIDLPTLSLSDILRKEDAILVRTLQREFVSKFILHYCSLSIRQPRDIYSFENIAEIYNSIHFSYKVHQRKYLPQFNHDFINLNKAVGPRFISKGQNRFWSEWTRHPSTNISMSNGKLPTIITSRVLEVFERVKGAVEALFVNMCIVQQLLGPERTSTALSVACLLKYHGLCPDGVYIHDISNRTEKQVQEILEKERKNAENKKNPNKTKSQFKQLQDKQNKELPKTLLILNFDQVGGPCLIKIIKEERSKNKYIIVSTEKKLELDDDDTIITQTELLKKEQLDVLTLEITSTSYAGEHPNHEEKLLENLQPITSTELFRHAQEKECFSLTMQKMPLKDITAASRRISIRLE